VAAALLALLGLGLARPDLLPWEVLGRRAALDRIGPPRVVTGAEAFESVPVSTASAWYQAADLDGEPGDEIARVAHSGATLLDPADFSERGRIAFTATPGSIWNGFSVLARLDGRPVIVQTGGGYSETEVLEPDGRLVFRHRPDASLPPRALRPADLDGDGALELYAAEGSAVARLDGEGRVVWRRPCSYGSGLLLSSPSRESEPAWVAAVGTDAVRVWDPEGRPLGERPASPGVLAIVDFAGGRALVRGGSATLLAETLGGSPVLTLDLGDFRPSDAVSVRFAAEGRAHLAVAAAGPRGVERWRILVVSPDGTVAYDEVLDHAVRLLTTRRRGGGETLLVGGAGLRALRPR
jgi:hypothetical protein